MEECVEVLEESLEPEFDFFSMGGGRVVVVVVVLLFSLGAELFFVTAVKGLVVVGVTELPSNSSPLDEGSYAVGGTGGGVEGAFCGGEAERAAL